MFILFYSDFIAGQEKMNPAFAIPFHSLVQFGFQKRAVMHSHSRPFIFTR
uniref:Uncharacterized protein n=1 Tax=Anguilla anguilla TaxID=7936 RepID=A0A0E9TI05_ANGAN